MNIIHPEASHLPSLRQLWKTAFGDTDAFLDDFLSTAYAAQRCRCIPLGDTIAAALYWLDCTCQNAKFAYLYAVATDPAHRGQGLCRALMADTIAVLKNRGYQGAILVPQQPGLIQMYAGMGFTPCSGVAEFHTMAGDAIPARAIDGAEFSNIRRTMLPPGGILQEGENLTFLQTQVTFYTGNHWLAAVAEVDGMLWCPEFLGDPAQASGLVKALGYAEGSFRMPGAERPFAMYRPLTTDCPRPGYFGFAFD